VELVRITRLKAAGQLLKTTDKTVAEVVGRLPGEER
jgi:hypothetical protein